MGLLYERPTITGIGERNHDTKRSIRTSDRLRMRTAGAGYRLPALMMAGEKGVTMKHILSFSGGKDSTYLAFYLIEKGYPLDEAVMFDTGWEFPQMYDHIEKMRVYFENHGIKFTTLKPKHSFDFLMLEKEKTKRDTGKVVKGNSWCGGGCRWGTFIKQKTLNRYCEKNIVYIGFAIDEQNRVLNLDYNKRAPLAENGITEAECLRGCYERGFTWDGLYEKLDRVSCKFCALKNLKELRNIYFEMPEVWDELREKQRMTDKPYKGDGKSVFQLETRFEFERERIAAGLSITNREFYRLLALRLEEVTECKNYL